MLVNAGQYEVTANPEQRRTLDAMLKEILDQPASGRLYATGRELRFALQDLGRERASVVIQSCVPTFVTEVGETFLFTLDGLLSVSDTRPRRMLSTMLGLVAARYRQPGGRRQYSFLWSDLRRDGGFSAVDFDVAYVTFNAAQLGQGGRPPHGASHDPMAPTYDYEFRIQESDLEAMADSADVERWATLQRERRAKLSPSARVTTLASEGTLEKPAATTSVKAAIATSKSSQLDLAVITILPEEYQAVLGCLDSHEHFLGSEPNLYSWKIGSVKVGTLVYSVVVALAGDPTNPVGALVTQVTVERFKPRYVVVLGVAGGFRAVEKGEAQELGDVVVSKIIHGYEYGKIMSKGFQPRADFTHRADLALANAAKTFISSGSRWWETISSQAPRPKARHGARVGEVASGDKVVDEPNDRFFKAVISAWPKSLAVEMEGSGAALAIEALHGLGYEVGLIMIRGISDMPGQLNEGGSVERDAWKPYAAESAARFLFALLRHNWPLEPLSRTREASGVGQGAKSGTTISIRDSQVRGDVVGGDKNG